MFANAAQDWYTDLRNTSCYVMQQLLLLTGPQLSAEARRAIYPELLKRLDDSSNQVRGGRGCGELQSSGGLAVPGRQQQPGVRDR